MQYSSQILYTTNVLELNLYKTQTTLEKIVYVMSNILLFA